MKKNINIGPDFL